MNDVIGALAKIVEAFGATAAAFACVAGVIFFFYRRDHMVKQDALKDIVSSVAKSNEKLAEAVSHVAETSRVSADASRTAADAYTRSLDTILRTFERRSHER